MALIPKPRVSRPDNLPVPAPPVMRAVAELEPERGYLSRELAELAVVNELTGEEDALVLQNGKARKTPLRYIVALAKETNTPPNGGGRIGGGGGRHTFERSVTRSPIAVPEATDVLMIVRDGETRRITLESVGTFAGDMLQAIYDADNDNVVDDSEKLGGQLPAYYLARANHTGTQLAATISDFSEAVDDRTAALIQNGTGITWSYNDAAGTLTPAVSLAPFTTANLAEGSNLYFTDERVDDRVAALLQNGTGISWSYNDGANTLTPTISLASFSTSNLSEGSNLYYTDERVDDRVAVLVQNGTGITWAYNDSAGTLTPTIGNLTTAQFAANVVDTDVALTANSNTRIASQAAVKAYADALIAANDAMVFKGVIDCSANPNYPAADRGHVYKVSVAGKIGGASGPNVEVGDQLLCITDGTASGNHATVGANWNIIQVNIDGAVVGPASSTDGNLALFNGTTGKVIKDGGVVSAFALTFLDDTTAAAVRTTLGLAAVAASGSASDLSTGTLAAARMAAFGSGDVSFASGGGAGTIAANAVTFAKMQQIASFQAVGNPTGSLANISTYGFGATFAFSGTTLQTGAGTGDVTWSQNSFTTTIANDAVTYAKMQNVSATDKLLGRSTAGAGDVEEIICTAAGRALIDDASASAQRATLGLDVPPTRQIFKSGTGATYTRPTSPTPIQLRIRMVGGGGGGAGSGSSGAGTGGDGTDTTFSTFTANKGLGAAAATPGSGGAAVATSGATWGLAGSSGGGAQAGIAGTTLQGGGGGSTTFFGATAPGAASTANSGSGGGGGPAIGAVTAGAGGGGGAGLEAVINSPALTYTYTVGTGGAGGSPGTSGNGGSAGSAGIIIVDEIYQ